VTDRCNLRCDYCMPAEGVPHIPHNEVLSFEEIERMARAAVKCGVKKVRVTGGEPLVRRGVVGLIERLAAVEGVEELPMTTNGVLLADYAEDLARAGLARVTVSMDTMKPERFEKIAGRPFLDKVMAGIEAAMAVGLGPVKINVVAVPGVNDDEAVDFARLADRLKVEVRFIERMPLMREGASTRCGLASNEYVPAAELKARIEAELGPMAPAPGGSPSQPAKVFDLPSGNGRVGFIAPMSEPFCKWCSRMRLTPDGKLRACLAEELELDVKGPLRAGASDEDLIELFEKAVAAKPEQDAACFVAGDRGMSRIGG